MCVHVQLLFASINTLLLLTCRGWQNPEESNKIFGGPMRRPTIWPKSQYYWAQWKGPIWFSGCVGLWYLSCAWRSSTNDLKKETKNHRTWDKFKGGTYALECGTVFLNPSKCVAHSHHLTFKFQTLSQINVLNLLTPKTYYFRTQKKPYCLTLTSNENKKHAPWIIELDRLIDVTNRFPSQPVHSSRYFFVERTRNHQKSRSS